MEAFSFEVTVNGATYRMRSDGRRDSPRMTTSEGPPIRTMIGDCEEFCGTDSSWRRRRERELKDFRRDQRKKKRRMCKAEKKRQAKIVRELEKTRNERIGWLQRSEELPDDVEVIVLDDSEDSAGSGDDLDENEKAVIEELWQETRIKEEDIQSEEEEEQSPNEKNAVTAGEQQHTGYNTRSKSSST